MPLHPQTSPPRRILVVEDDSVIRRLNAEVLTRSGYQVNTVEDGAAAWNALVGDGYDLMITDNMMPTLTGEELLKKLRAARMAVPVIMARENCRRRNSTNTPCYSPPPCCRSPIPLSSPNPSPIRSSRSTG
jgi:CheY-like chemotaxis protein